MGRGGEKKLLVLLKLKEKLLCLNENSLKTWGLGFAEHKAAANAKKMWGIFQDSPILGVLGEEKGVLGRTTVFWEKKKLSFRRKKKEF